MVVVAVVVVVAVMEVVEVVMVVEKRIASDEKHNRGLGLLLAFVSVNSAIETCNSL